MNVGIKLHRHMPQGRFNVASTSTPFTAVSTIVLAFQATFALLEPPDLDLFCCGGKKKYSP
jgi:hypothetical protein